MLSELRYRWMFKSPQLQGKRFESLCSFSVFINSNHLTELRSLRSNGRWLEIAPRPSRKYRAIEIQTDVP